LGYRFRPRPPVDYVRNPDWYERQTDDGKELLDSKPLTVPVRLPSIDQRLALYERAGQARQEFYDYLFDPENADQLAAFINGDDFGDDYDDIPTEGLSPHEYHPIKDAAKADKEARKASKAKSATPLQAEPPAAPTAKPEGEAGAS